MEVLKEIGHSVTGITSGTCDLTKDGSLKIFNGEEFDQIFHLAAWTQAGDFCLFHSGEQWIINQKINTNVLSWWAEFQPQAKLVSIGTSCSYSPELPLEEKNYLEGQPIQSLFTYGMTKRMLHVGLLALNKQYGLKYLNLVPSTLYGPGYHTDDRQMHFIFDLIRKILRGKYFGDSVVLWGDGYQRREIIHVNDFVQLAIKLSHSIDDEVINIGAGEDHTIRYFAQIICDIVGFEFKNIKFDISKYVGAKSKCLETSKLKKLIPNLQLTPLKKGISETISWFDEFYFKKIS